MCEPHASSDAFACDISKHGKDGGAVLRKSGEVAGKETSGEDLAGKLEGAGAQHARTTELALNLGGIEDLRMQIRSFPEQRVHILMLRQGGRRYLR